MSLGIRISQNRFSVLGDEFSSSKKSKQKSDLTSGKAQQSKNQSLKNKQKENQFKV